MTDVKTLENLNFLRAQPKLLKYFAVAKVNYNNVLTYLTNVFSRCATVMLRVWIFTQLYKVTYSTFKLDEVGGLTLVMVIWALMLTQSFQSATRPGVARIIEREVKSGSLAYSINRPYSYILFHYFGFLGRIFPNLIINILIGIIAVLILAGPIAISGAGLVFGLVLLFIGYTIDFYISLIIGLLSFWLEETSALMWIYSKGQLVFGGVILPIALFPDSLRGIAEVLPFSQLYYSAARLIVNFNWPLFGKFILIQLVWLLIFSLLARFIFNKGIKYVNINGG